MTPGSRLDAFCHVVENDDDSASPNAGVFRWRELISVRLNASHSRIDIHSGALP